MEMLDGAHYLIQDVTGVEAETLPGDAGLVLKFTPLAG
jgi:hypothetical protein